jgi:hypothetical protein
MTDSGSPVRLLDQHLALDAYLEELLSDARGERRPQPPLAVQVRLFTVAGLALAVPLERIKGIVTGPLSLSPAPDGSSLLIGLLQQGHNTCRVVDIGRLVLPQGGAKRSEDHRPGCIILLEPGGWALACERLGDAL